MASNPAPILAAGAVLWRPSRKHGVKVALIHRPRYGDWSLPKGKSRPGESLLATALREVREETGYAVRLARRIAAVSYPVPSGHKTVHYFAGCVTDGDFQTNKEVDELTWLPLAKAHKRLNHRYDKRVLDDFAALPPDLSAVVLVRHARAGQRDSFPGDDADRPLDSRGMRHAAALAPELLAFGPVSVFSAPLARCRQTVRPLADMLRVQIGDENALSEREYQRDPAAARRRITELALLDGGSGPAVVCSQGGVIPGVVKSLASRAGISLPTVTTPKGAFWVLSLQGKQLRQADRYALPDS